MFLVSRLCDQGILGTCTENFIQRHHRHFMSPTRRLVDNEALTSSETPYGCTCGITLELNQLAQEHKDPLGT